MISSIELKSNDIDDDNYSPVFQRSKKEFVLKVSDKVTQEVSAVTPSLSRSKTSTPTTGRDSSKNITEVKMTTPSTESGRSTKSDSPTSVDICSSEKYLPSYLDPHQKLLRSLFPHVRLHRKNVRNLYPPLESQRYHLSRP